MAQIMGGIQAFLKDEEGATMVEYGLMVALIAVVAAVAVYALGTQLSIRFNKVSSCVATPTTPCT